MLGLPPKPTYDVECFTSTHECVFRSFVEASLVIPMLTEVMRRHDVTVWIDGEDVTAAAKATPALIRAAVQRRGPSAQDEPVESGGPGYLDVTTAWRFFLTDDNVLHRVPLVAELRGGLGPGDLSWQPFEDHGIAGLRSVHRAGTFVILRVASDTCALMNERSPGDWAAIGTGPPEVLKQHAAAHVRARCMAPVNSQRRVDSRSNSERPTEPSKPQATTAAPRSDRASSKFRLGLEAFLKWKKKENNGDE